MKYVEQCSHSELTKVPSPDGFNIRFYQYIWQILWQDFLDIYQAFYDGNIDLTRFNRAYIALISKMAGARLNGEFWPFWPISLINGILKIISKILACKLNEKIGTGLIRFPSLSLYSEQCYHCSRDHVGMHQTQLVNFLSQTGFHKIFWHNWLVLSLQGSPSSRVQ